MIVAGGAEDMSTHCEDEERDEGRIIMSRYQIQSLILYQAEAGRWEVEPIKAN